MLFWLPQAASQAINWNRVGPDGKTNYHRSTGRSFNRQRLEFGEKVYVKEVLGVKGPKRDWQARMVAGCYVGHCNRTGSIIILNKDGAILGAACKRLPKQMRWSQEAVQGAIGLPWDVKEKKGPMPLAVEKDRPTIVVKEREEPKEAVPRKFYVMKEDVDEFGKTPQCPGCRTMGTGMVQQAHNESCRKRIFDQLEIMDNRRVAKYRTKMQSKGSEKVVDGAEAELKEDKMDESTGELLEELPGTKSEVRSEANREPAEKRASAEEAEAEESPEKKTKWDRQAHSVYSKRKAEDQGEDAGRGDEAQGSGTATSIMDMVDEAENVQAEPPSLSLLEFSEGGFAPEKAELLSVAAMQVERVYRKEGVRITPEEKMQIAQLQVALGGVDFMEIFSPSRFAEMAGRFSLRHGTAIDLTETRKSDGKQWDLTNSEHVEDVEKLQDADDPYLLMGCPPCESYSPLLQISESKRDPTVVAEQKKVGKQCLQTAVHFYRRQMLRGRYFVHEHPSKARSYQEDCIVELEKEDGVYSAKSPMCAFDMVLDLPPSDPRSGQENTFVFKEGKFLTNSEEIAKELDNYCTNEDPECKLEKHFHVSLIGGIAMRAQKYPPKMVAAILRGLKRQLKKDGHLSSLDTDIAGPVPSYYHEEEMMQRFYDDISGEELPANLVKEAREKEIAWVNKIKLYEKVPREAGKEITSVRWVDVNKGDGQDLEKFNVRSRLVGREIKNKMIKQHGSDPLSAASLFSAMPPWEVIKILFSLLVSDGIDDMEDFDPNLASVDDELEMGIFDISRAHFMPKAERELFIEIPPEDRVAEDDEKDRVGKLLRNMYGFRDASNLWQIDWQGVLKEGGYAVGKANPALFWNRARRARGAVHGDDFYVLGNRAAIDAMAELLKSKYDVRESHRLGFGSHCSRQASVLNRIVTLGHDGDGRKFVQIEPDARHTELILRALGLTKASKPISKPGVKVTDAEHEKRKLEPKLVGGEVKVYRSAVMRASFLAQDRADLGEAVKSLAQGMSSPTRAHMADLKILGRYLVGKPHLALVFKQQRMPKELKITVDSDHATDKTTRKSTTGMVQRLGLHTVKQSSNLQTPIGLNVSEAEYYALCHGAAHGLGLQSFMRDIGIDLKLVVESDSTSAKSFASRRGLGKQRHVETRYLWLQDRVAFKHLEIKKVATRDNVSDILTKSIDAPTLQRHLRTMGFVEVEKSSMQKAAG